MSVWVIFLVQDVLAIPQRNMALAASRYCRKRPHGRRAAARIAPLPMSGAAMAWEGGGRLARCGRMADSVMPVRTMPIPASIRSRRIRRDDPAIGQGPGKKAWIWPAAGMMAVLARMKATLIPECGLFQPFVPMP
ncbi:MAG: hypothetical protein QM682_02585 [Paracoccus sp. (in: a-proteobacteria)]|uniref:hypothetical protein n=1 Tax=Paracoccus sp. TaxID=267 RepID=UPI0039E42C5F